MMHNYSLDGPLFKSRSHTTFWSGVNSKGVSTGTLKWRMESKANGTVRLKRLLTKEGVSPESANPVLEQLNSSPIKQQVKLSSLITRPGVSMDEIREMNKGLTDANV